MLLVLRCLRWLESTLLGQFSAYFLWAVKMWPFFNRMLMANSSVCNRSSTQSTWFWDLFKKGAN